MGLYVNPGNGAFKMSRYSDIYVDKSMLISRTNALYKTEKRFLCVSRPRRFGKSMAANMLSAYYSRGCNSAEIFSGLKIANTPAFQAHLNRHDVIRLDVQQFLFQESHLDIFIDEMQKAVTGNLRKEYGDCFETGPYGLAGALNQIYAATGKGFIFIIDEWDCVFRIAREQENVQKRYLDFLRGLFKGADYADLVYMTGILPIKKYGEHSAINIFDEYSMIDSRNLGEYFGFTEEEVRQQCGKHGMEYAELERWYDGYLSGGQHIYNPKSVADALMWKKCKSYWTGTETYEALKVYIDRNYDGLREAVIEMLGNGRCKINSRKFQNDMTTFTSKDDVLMLLVHLGYLTFDENTEEVFIPNQEITQEFLSVVDGPAWKGLTDALNRSEELLKQTWALNGDAVAKNMEAIHNETTSLLKYNNENSLTCTVLLAYYSAKMYYMNPIMELPSGKGFADVVYLPKPDADCPALVVELKWNRSARGAIKQIKNKEYASWIQQYTGDILLVGINYSQKTKKHICVIERWKK